MYIPRRSPTITEAFMLSVKRLDMGDVFIVLQPVQCEILEIELPFTVEWGCTIRRMPSQNFPLEECFDLSLYNWL